MRLKNTVIIHTLGYYCDYNWKKKKISSKVTPAGMYPLCFFNLYPESMEALGKSAAKVISERFIKRWRCYYNRCKYQSAMGYTQWMGAIVMDDGMGTGENRSEGTGKGYFNAMDEIE